jgi:myosin heavy subunit
MTAEENVPQVLAQIVAGILHFGNVSFVENPDEEDNERQKCLISEDGKMSLDNVSSVLGIDSAMLKRCLLFRLVQLVFAMAH